MKIYGEGLLLNITSTNITLNRWGIFKTDHHMAKQDDQEKAVRIGHYSRWEAVVQAGRKADLNDSQMRFILETKDALEGFGRINDIKIRSVQDKYIFSKEKLESSRFVYFITSGQLGVRLKAKEGSSSPDQVIGYFVSPKNAFVGMATYSLCKNQVPNASITLEELNKHCQSVYEEFDFINKHLY